MTLSQLNLTLSLLVGWFCLLLNGRPEDEILSYSEYKVLMSFEFVSTWKTYLLIAKPQLNLL